MWNFSSWGAYLSPNAIDLEFLKFHLGISVYCTHQLIVSCVVAFHWIIGFKLVAGLNGRWSSGHWVLTLVNRPMQHGTHGRKCSKLSMYSQRKNHLTPLNRQLIGSRQLMPREELNTSYIAYIFHRLSKQMVVRCVWACKYISDMILPLEFFY